MTNESDSNIKSKLLAAAGLGMELLGLVIVLFYAGRYVDTKYELPGYGVTVGGMLALVIWLTHVVKIIQGLDKEDS